MRCERIFPAEDVDEETSANLIRRTWCEFHFSDFNLNKRTKKEWKRNYSSSRVKRAFPPVLVEKSQARHVEICSRKWRKSVCDENVHVDVDALVRSWNTVAVEDSRGSSSAEDLHLKYMQHRVLCRVVFVAVEWSWRFLFAALFKSKIPPLQRWVQQIVWNFISSLCLVECCLLLLCAAYASLHKEPEKGSEEIKIESDEKKRKKEECGRVENKSEKKRNWNWLQTSRKKRNIYVYHLSLSQKHWLFPLCCVVSGNDERELECVVISFLCVHADVIIIKYSSWIVTVCVEMTTSSSSRLAFGLFFYVLLSLSEFPFLVFLIKTYAWMQNQTICFASMAGLWFRIKNSTKTFWLGTD